MKTIGIYPGNYQPPHQGHYKSYLKLKRISGPDTFVITTDYDPSLDAPLHFGDKEQILVRHGIPDSHIKKVKNINMPLEVLNNYDPLTTVVIYGLNINEAKKKISSNRYYEYLQNAQGHLKPFKQQAYIFIVDDNKVGDQTFSSRNVREALGSHRFTDDQKKKWFKHFFGWFDLGLFELLKNKYTNAHQSFDGINAPASDVKEEIKKEICKILNELMGSPPSIATDSSYGSNNSIATDDQSASDEREESSKQKQDLVKQKQQSERDLKSLESDLKWKKNSVLGLRKDQIPNKRDELDALSKQISQTKPNSSPVGI